MILSIQGEKLIKTLEGINPKAYKDSLGYWTIGYGHLILPSEEYLKQSIWSIPQMDQIFKQDIKPVELWLNANCQWMDTIKQYEFDSLCSLLFNTGINIQKKYPNTYKAIVSGDRAKIIGCMYLINNKGLLTSRRKKEIAYFQGLG